MVAAIRDELLNRKCFVLPPCLTQDSRKNFSDEMSPKKGIMEEIMANEPSSSGVIEKTTEKNKEHGHASTNILTDS